MVRKNETSFFSVYAISLMVIGTAMVTLSLLLPGGFNNGLIRIMNYWTMFAAPIAVLALQDIPYKKSAAIVIGVFAVLCVVATSKDPILFNYEGYWDASDYAAAEWACLDEGIVVESYITNPSINHSKLYNLETLKQILSLKSGIPCGSRASGDFSLVKGNKVVDTYADGHWEMVRITSNEKSGIIQGALTRIESVGTPAIIPTLSNDDRCSL